jgi:hypothetical protein
MKSSLKIIFLLSAFSILFSCENKLEEEQASININFANLFNASPLVLENVSYTSAKGASFLVNEFKYYISNVKLINSQTGKMFSVPDSYYLIERKTTSHIDQATLSNIPIGQYDQIEFAVGVDKARNLSIDQVGDLDPSNNMAWDWKTGYKFLLLEGFVFATSGERRGLVYHIGADENYRVINLKMNPILKVEKNKTNVLDINVEVSRLFNSPNLIDIGQNRTVMFGEVSNRVADNYATMFSIDKVGQ